MTNPAAPQRCRAATTVVTGIAQRTQRMNTCTGAYSEKATWAAKDSDPHISRIRTPQVAISSVYRRNEIALWTPGYATDRAQRELCGLAKFPHSASGIASLDPTRSAQSLCKAHKR